MNKCCTGSAYCPLRDSTLLSFSTSIENYKHPKQEREKIKEMAPCNTA
jgi:predicted metal-binding transcription factor (methanogenesis marker protein 9)